MAERGTKRKFWVGLSGVLGRVNFTQTSAGSGLPYVPLSAPTLPPKIKKLAPPMLLNRLCESV